MPTYEYKCDSCKEQFEVFQKMSDEPLKKCPSCQGDIRRLISGGAGLLFKGSGFYTTDYRKSDYKTKEKSESKSTETCTPNKCSACEAKNN